MGATVGLEEPQTLRVRRTYVVVALLGVLLGLTFALGSSPVASAAAAHPRFRVHRLCHTPRPGAAACLGMKLVPASLTSADLRANADRQSKQQAGAARPAVSIKSPFPGYLTPERLHAAYALPAETRSSSLQTIAIVDAFDDPTAEADLDVYDKQFALPACTSANGCFRKINEAGNASPLPHKNGEWAGEISIDVQMARAICPACRIVLAEASSEEFTDLGATVNAAASAGATVISNSYGGPEDGSYIGLNSSYFNHPGTVVTASSGDCGYLNQACTRDAHVANFPADSPDVVAVGGTSLTSSGEAWTSTAWDEGGSGCSVVFSAAPWQSSAAGFSATGCGSGRSIADVSAIGDPETGVDVYDSTPEGNGDPTGWGVWGGTSVSSPIVAAEFALAGGAQGVSYPAATLYSHLGDPSALYDVVSGTNGSCAGASSCEAIAGYDGPTGVGSPLGLGAFSIAGAPVNSVPPTVSGAAEQGQTLGETHGTWTNSPTASVDQWEACNGAGSYCSAIAGATGQTYTITPADVGSSIRVQEIASDASGSGAPAVSSQTAVVSSDVPSFTGFTPTSAITSASVTINGSALSGVSEVLFGSLPASFTVISPAEIEASVPNGAKPAKITLVSSAASVTNKAKFTPTFSVTGFSPASAAAGKLVSIKGVGFTSGSRVAFNGIASSSVSFLSSKKLKAAVPAGAGSGQITVTNTAAPAGTVTSAGSFAGS
jgi:hypothetical protein